MPPGPVGSASKGGAPVSGARTARRGSRKPPTVSLPRGPLYQLAYMSEALARIMHKESMLTVAALKMVQHKMFFSSVKAKREFGYSTQPWRLAVADALLVGES